MKPSLIERDVRTWDEIGEHRTGSPGDAATSEWLAQQILAAGVTPEIDRFPFVRRAPGCCEVGASRTCNGQVVPCGLRRVARGA